MTKQSCNTCMFMQSYRSSKLTANILDDIYREEAPDASPEAIQFAIGRLFYVQSKVLEAEPTCPGWNKGRLIAWLLANKLFDGFDSPQEIIDRHCNNSFKNSEEFQKLDEQLDPKNIEEAYQVFMATNLGKQT